MKDAVETMCTTMWCICCVASTSIKKIILRCVLLSAYYKHSGNNVTSLLVNTCMARRKSLAVSNASRARIPCPRAWRQQHMDGVKAPLSLCMRLHH